MKDKEKQIEEMARDIEKYVVRDWSKELYIGSAEALYNAGYRNVKDKVVLDKEEYEDLKEYKNIAEQRKFNLDYANVELRRLAVELNSVEEANESANKLLDKYREELRKASELKTETIKLAKQETAREILKAIKFMFVNTNYNIDWIVNKLEKLAKEYNVEVE